MEAVRDLGRVEPWQESLERSRARRAARAPSQPAADRPARGAATVSATRARPGGRGAARRPRLLLAGAGGMLTVVLLALTLSSVPSGRGARASARMLRADLLTAPTALVHAGSGGVSPSARTPRMQATDVGGDRTCGPVVGSSGYVNPLAGAQVTPERVDQGVDYAGSGTLTALGPGRVTYVGTSATGWPGAFIEYRLTSGPDVGCYVYYAEGINPAPDLHVGETVSAGQAMARIIPGWATGVELGWGAGTSTLTYAAMKHQWSARSDADSIASSAGKSFSALIASLGGPAGKVEG